MADHAERAPVADGPPPAPRRRRAARIRTIGLFAGGIVAALLAILVYRALVPGPAPLTQRDVTDAITKALASQTPAPALSVAAYAVDPARRSCSSRRPSPPKANGSKARARQRRHHR